MQIYKKTILILASLVLVPLVLLFKILLAESYFMIKFNLFGKKILIATNDNRRNTK